MQPAEKLARKGFPVSYSLAKSLKTEGAMLSQFPDSNQIFLRNGNYYKEGEILIQSDLAATFRRLIEHGWSARIL